MEKATLFPNGGNGAARRNTPGVELRGVEIQEDRATASTPAETIAEKSLPQDTLGFSEQEPWVDPDSFPQDSAVVTKTCSYWKLGFSYGFFEIGFVLSSDRLSVAIYFDHLL